MSVAPRWHFRSSASLEQRIAKLASHVPRSRVMGLLDMLQGMTNTSSAPAAGGRSGMSPLTMGLLALLAYKTMKGQGPLGGLFGQGAANAGPAPAPESSGGGIFNWMQNALGGAAAGGAGGALVSGGLGELLNRFEQNGLGGVAQSWVGNGPNQPLAPDDVEQAVGSDTLDTLARETGMSRDQLVSRLSAELPQAVDKLTPHGRVPTAQEAAVSA
jgi:uncharacterized protein YidB (DUF937 family)